MEIWSLTPDTPRQPQRVRPGESVGIPIGSWPIEPGQSVWVTYTATSGRSGRVEEHRVDAAWERNGFYPVLADG